MNKPHVLLALLLAVGLVLPGIVADAAPAPRADAAVAPRADAALARPAGAASGRLVDAAVTGTVGLQEPEPSEEGESKDEDEDLPLDGARHFGMSTDVGTWISLDVGPEGERIVFDLMGDLYLLPFAGGEATRITSGMQFDSQPRFSPDGSEIVYISDASGGENVWILDLEERDEETGEYETTQVTRGNNDSYISPEWMPDGEYIVVSKSPGPKLWMFHREGGSGFQLIEEPDRLKTVGAAFGGDDRYIWYAQRTGSWQYNAIFPQYQIAYYDRETGETFTRTSRFGSAVRPTLSPDGRWLVYATRFEAETGLRIRDLETGQERWLAYPVQRDDQESTATRDAYPGMSFTPDSSHLVAYWGGRIWKVPVEGGDPVGIPFTAQIDIDYGPEVFFEYPVSDEPTFTATQIRDAVASPDGSRLAFTALDRLWVLDWPDGEPRRLTDTEDVVEAQPTWSPDGQWIGYVTWSPEEGGNVHKIPAAGGDAVRLTRQEGIYQQPAWSPDGDRIVAIRGPARVWAEAVTQGAFGASDDIVWVPAEGGDATVIAPTEGRGNPHFAGDADRIWLNSRSEGLISIRWDGTDQEGHLQVEGRSQPGSSFTPSASAIYMAPRGSKALAMVGQNLYVVTVPRIGGETPTVSVASPDRAPVPVRKLTDIGGQFPAWGPDGRKVHWSMGNAHFVYDLDAAEAAERAAEEAEAEADEEAEDEPEEGEGEPDPEGEQEEEEAEEEEDEPAYRPEEVRVLVDAGRDVPRGAAVLRGARVITMVDDEVIEDADVLVRDARIEAVGPRGEVDVPDDARVIDVEGRTIIPGFVDTHAHLRPTFGIHKTQSWSYLANLAYGVTTTRDPQTSSTDVLTYSDKVKAGMMLGPRIYSTGPGIFRGENIEDLDHARDVVRRYSDYYGTNTIKMYMSGNRQQRQWIIMAAREEGLMPTTEGGLDFKYNLTMAIDGYPGQEHSLPIVPVHDDVVRFVAETGLFYTPTLLVAYGGPWAENWFFTRENPYQDEKLRHFTPYSDLARKTRRRGQGTGPGPGGWFMEEEHVFPRLAKVVADIVHAGGKAGVGSHGQLQGLGYHWELWAMQSGGLSEHEALRVATLFGAQAIGVQGDLGSIEAGKLADLVVLEQNPLENIRNTNTIRWVMKNGRLYDGDSLDEVYPRQRELGRVYGLGDWPERITEEDGSGSG